MLLNPIKRQLKANTKNLQSLHLIMENLPKPIKNLIKAPTKNPRKLRSSIPKIGRMHLKNQPKFPMNMKTPRIIRIHMENPVNVYLITTNLVKVYMKALLPVPTATQTLPLAMTTLPPPLVTTIAITTVTTSMKQRLPVYVHQTISTDNQG